MSDRLKEIENKYVNFDLGKVGNYLLKVDASLEIVMYNQAKILAHLEKGNAEAIYDEMKTDVNNHIIDTFHQLSEKWK